MFLQFSGATAAGAEVLAGRCLPPTGHGARYVKTINILAEFSAKIC